MKKITEKIFIAVIILIGIFSFNPTVFAVDPLTAVFNPNPLFSENNFLPGDVKQASVTINNNFPENQEVYIEAVNVKNDDGLADQIRIKILENSSVIYNENFEDFLNAGPVPLSSISAGGSKTYKLEAVLLENSQNDYQGKTLGFDICVGFAGGNSNCTNDIVISQENNSGGGSSGSGSGGTHLVIYNERNDAPIPQTTSITIRWETNKPATSQVIYGLAEKNYVLDLNLPNFGYDFATEENLTKIINHEVVLSGLEIGKTYKYRVVSRASPATVSYEHEFTVPSITASGPQTINYESGGALEGQSEAKNEKEDLGIVGEIAGVSDQNVAATVFSFGKFSWWWFIILLLFIIFWFVLKKKRENF